MLSAILVPWPFSQHRAQYPGAKNGGTTSKPSLANALNNLSGASLTLTIYSIPGLDPSGDDGDGGDDGTKPSSMPAFPCPWMHSVHTLCARRRTAGQ